MGILPGVVAILTIALIIITLIISLTMKSYKETKLMIDAGMCQQLVKPDVYYHTGGDLYVWKKCEDVK